MRRYLVSLLLTVTLSACAGAPAPVSPPPSASSGPVRPAVGTQSPGTSAGAAKPTVACLEGLSSATCARAVRVVLAAVAPSGWTPTQVWIGSGSLCPWLDCLFDPNQNFPTMSPPSGGQWVGDAAPPRP